MSREDGGRGSDWCGRERSSNRGRSFGGSGGSGGGGGGGGFQRVFGGRSVHHNLRPQQDMEEELLRTINSEFQVNCTQRRKIADIYEQVKQKPHLHNLIYGSIESLKKFIGKYKENFVILPDNETVRWLAEQRVVSKNDRKEHLRQIQRDYNKECAEERYDIVYEVDVLSFITALFLTTGESWLRLARIEKAVKQAFHSDNDLIDYVASNVKNYLSKRDHMFKEHLDQIQFYGVNNYNVVHSLNKHIRKSDRDNHRETVRALHEYYLKEVGDDVRKELKMDDRKSFCDFLLRCKFVFDYNANDTHVGSKMEIPLLTFKRERLMKEFNEVVDVFNELHKKKSEKLKDKNPVACNVDESEHVLVFDGSQAKKGNGKKPTGAKSSVDSEQASSVTVSPDNPFEQHRAATAYTAAAANTAAADNTAAANTAATTPDTSTAAASAPSAGRNQDFF